MGVNQKMKLYNVYRLCKKYIDVLDNVDTIKKDVLNAAQTQRIIVYTITNWNDLKDTLDKVSKIPALANNVYECIKSIPSSIIEEDRPCLVSEKYNNFINKKDILLSKMHTIIELYESMNIPEGNIGFDIKLPHCEDLKDYISYLKSIDFIFSQCPFLQCENELLKFGAVDVGSNWIRLTIAATSTCIILNNMASVIDKSLELRSHYINIQQQEEMLKATQLKNELTEDQIKFLNSLRDATMNNYINQLESELGQIENPEDRDKAERSLEELILLLDKGCEIYATLDSPEEVQVLFPEIQGNLELSDDIIKYLEEKEPKEEK